MLSNVPGSSVKREGSLPAVSGRPHSVPRHMTDICQYLHNLILFYRSGKGYLFYSGHTLRRIFHDFAYMTGLAVQLQQE